jgi:hypothetical protein
LPWRGENEDPDSKKIRDQAMLSAMIGIGPRDPVEGILATQGQSLKTGAFGEKHALISRVPGIALTAAVTEETGQVWNYLNDSSGISHIIQCAQTNRQGKFQRRVRQCINNVKPIDSRYQLRAMSGENCIHISIDSEPMQKRARRCVHTQYNWWMRGTKELHHLLVSISICAHATCQIEVLARIFYTMLFHKRL